MSVQRQRGVGRYAPSPTGDFHLGNLRTALLAWAIARNASADFVVRMEDLDERSRPEFVKRQLDDLEAIGITWDGPVIFQSERLPLYEEVFSSLSARGLLYECYCTRKELAEVASAPHRPPGSYPGTCRDFSAAEREAGRAKLAGMNRGPALRLRTEKSAEMENSGDDVVVVPLTLRFHDEVEGDYVGAIDDMVIRRGDGVYSYNFVSVVDDAAQGVTHIVRGDDLVPSTPRQIYLQRLIEAPTPVYFHVPLVLNGEGVRLAKRDGAVTLRALADYGWKPGDVVELIGQSVGIEGARDAQEFAEGLSLEALTKGSWWVDPVALEAGPGAVLKGARRW